MTINKTHQAVILFADLVGSARLSEVYEPEMYDKKIILRFQKSIDTALRNCEIPSTEVLHVDGGVRGDELVLVMVVDNRCDPFKVHKVAKIAIKLAVDLNIGWFLRQKERIDKKSAPYRLGIGIHYGPVILKKHPRGIWEKLKNNEVYKWSWSHKPTQSPEGYAINFAKRVETASRICEKTGIAISQSFLSVCRQAGLPIIIGDPLQIEAKGFELKEPIYELIAQDIVTKRDEFDFKKGGGNLEILQSAFNRDPERTFWLMELGIETNFILGSLEKTRENAVQYYDRAIRLGEETAKVFQQPARLLYRVARCYHRLGNTKGELGDIQKAIRYYEYAAHTKDPNLIWAALDTAAAHWKLAESEHLIGKSERMNELKIALRHCNDLIIYEPRFFYAYNLRALIAADLTLLLYQSKNGTRIKRLLGQARIDLAIAREINPKPEYLYLGTQARIEFASSDIKAMQECLSKAEDSLASAIKQGKDRIPAEDFYQPGLAVLGFQPPRPSQLRASWDQLKKRSKN